MKKIILGFLILLTISCNNEKNQRPPLNEAEKNVVIENMLTRRAIRKYTSQQVEKTKLDTLLKSAIYAPSALNKQPWEVRVVQNKVLIDKINERFVAYAKGRNMQGSAARAAEPGFSVFHGATTVIVVARDVENNYSFLDVGLLTQNMLLSAHAIGLGTCPIGSVVPILNDPENSDLTDLLKFPQGYEVALAISVGYPDEKPVAKERFAEKIIYIE